jgi:ribonucleoside-diphosphate reductase alpha chain
MLPGEMVRGSEILAVRKAWALLMIGYGNGTQEYMDSLGESFLEKATPHNKGLLLSLRAVIAQYAGQQDAEKLAEEALRFLEPWDSVMRIAALISKSGGGNGFNFSSLRPAGSAVGGTGGVSSGPISFIKVYDAATESVKQGGVRKGANMGILEVWHPDIVEFIKCKAENGILKNFNLSVGVSESFFEAVEKDTDWELFWINKNGQKEVSKFIKARDLFSLIVEYAHKNGEPGMVFMDRLQAANVVPSVPIKATNPCGEQPLPAWSSCVLGSINLSEFVVNGEINWEHLREVIRHATRFLDNIVTVNEYPVPIIKEKHDEQRRIGLGVTGLADLLIKLGLPYGSKEGRELAKGIMEFINVESHAYSVELGQERGSFPLFEQSTGMVKYQL